MSTDQELQEWFEAVILDHGEDPRHFGAPERHTHRAQSYNPICGDRFTIFLSVEDAAISSACFDGRGCTLSVAAHSMMCEALTGATIAEFETLRDQVRAAVEGRATASPGELGELAALSVISRAPARQRCALIGWEAVERALSANS